MVVFLKKLLFWIPVGLGVLAVVYAVRSREAPTRIEPEERITAVRVVEAESVRVVRRAVGHGSVKPGRVWEAVGEVSGTVVYLHPELRRGAILPAGTELLRIDPTDYRHAVAEIQANIRAADSQLSLLDVRAVNAKRSLAIEERNLALARKQHGRTRELLRRGVVSQSDADRDERTVLASEQAVQNLRNTVRLLPAERAAQQAQRDRLKSQLETARRNLDRTTVVAPFACRIAAVNVEEAQFAAKGQVLVEADSLDVAEVNAQVPLSRVLALLQSRPGPVPEVGAVIPRLREELRAVVRLRSGDVAIEWPARFSRVSDTVDPRTRTVGIIVAVDQPYRRAEAGRRPPLVKNMYVEVEIRGPPRPEAIVIPRTALRGSRVHVVNAEDRLASRDVVVEYAQDNWVALRSGLAPGERVVISDLPFAAEGMRLRPEPDPAASASLVDEATGVAPAR